MLFASLINRHMIKGHMVIIAGWIAIEAMIRLYNPSGVLSTPMLFVAIAGLVVNIVGLATLHRGDSHHVNMQGALLHVVSDLLGSVAAITAAIIIMFTGWSAADPVLSLVVVLIILRNGYALVKRSGHILLEGAQDLLDLATIKESLHEEFPEILNAHPLHA